MIDKKVKELLNEQINKEFFSAYLYLDIANFYTDKGLDGFANWFTIQAQEERDHAILFQTFLANNSESVKLLAIAAPDKDFKDFISPLKEALAHEEFVTASINNIYAAALSAKEYKTTQFLNWFIQEQVEEEKNATDLITKYELYATDGKGLYELNNELSTRVYSAPTLILD